MAFEVGSSGNPAGRPPGIRDRRQAMRDKLATHADELIAKVVELAKAGIERLIPPAKAKDDPVDLPELKKDALGDCGKAVLTALAEGRITPEESATIMSALSAQVRVVEATDLEQRIAALEATAKGGKQ